MRQIDRLHLEFPFAGARMLRGLLAARWEQDRPPACQNADEADGDRGALPPSAHDEARAGAQDLPVSAARHGGRAAEPGVGDGHHVHPDGEGLRLSRRGARLVLAAVLSWRVSITIEASFCVEALEEALARHGRPEIFNTDQGAQFTGAAFTGVLTRMTSRDQHGRQGRLAGQRVRRAAVAHGEIRGGLPARLRQRAGRTRLNRAVPRSLQSRIGTPIWLCD